MIKFKLFSSVLLRCPTQSLKKVFSFTEEIPPLFEEGLYLSSFEFWKEYKKKQLLTGKSKDKLEKSLMKYWIRSCMRCTPYGTFAGSLMVNLVNDDTDILLNDSSHHIRHIRIDMNYMSEIICAVGEVPNIKKQILFFPNNSLYELPDSYRYAEYSIKNDLRTYQISSVEKYDYIIAILGAAKAGATIEQLSELLKKSQNVTEDEAEIFIFEMIHSQLLVSELEPSVTGSEPLQRLIEQLIMLKGTENIVKQFENVRNLIKHPEIGTDTYIKAKTYLSEIGIPVKDSKTEFQTDLFLSAKKKTLDERIVHAIITQAEDLVFLSRPYKNSELANFIKKFRAKYEEAEIPLSLALDSDLGIGYAGIVDETIANSEFINDLPGINDISETASSYDYIQRYVLDKYHTYIANRESLIKIEEAELKKFEKNGKKNILPNSLYLVGNLLKENSFLNDRQFVFNIQSFGGPSGGRFLGRFAHGDEKLCAFVKQILKEEEKLFPDAVYAEVVHLPQARVGNLILRPVFRKYEIPYVGISGADPENQIFLTDLFISVVNNEIVLRSKKLNKQVIPRLTNAHNFINNSLPAYKFLCDLQSQNVSMPSIWDWGNLERYKYLPRVIYKNLVIKKARWNIEEKELVNLPAKKEDYLIYFQQFIENLKMPSRVLYVEGDNALLIDFNCLHSIELFLHYLGKRKKITIEEFLFDNENCVVRDINGDPYTNEIIIPLYHESKLIVNSLIKRKPEGNKRRFFPPGSEWLYYKIYCGPKTAETILKTILLSFVDTCITQNNIEYFFFIRYKDDFSHLRIRFANSNKYDLNTVQIQFSNLLQDFLDKGLISKISIDTYVRELERYGDDIIENVERLFFNDSLAVLRFIELIEGEEGEMYRFFFSLRAINMLLDDFKFKVEGKQELLRRMKFKFINEFANGEEEEGALQKKLNEKYRKYQQRIFSYMSPLQDKKNEIEDGIEVFNERSRMNSSVIKDLLLVIPENDIESRLMELLPSIIHMFMNRMFVAKQRKYELIVYYFLEKYYSSQIAIVKYEKNNKV